MRGWGLSQHTLGEKSGTAGTGWTNTVTFTFTLFQHFRLQRAMFFWGFCCNSLNDYLLFLQITGCKGYRTFTLPGAISAVIGSNSDIAEKLPLGFLTSCLCKAHACKTYAQFKLWASVMTPLLCLFVEVLQHKAQINQIYFTPFYFCVFTVAYGSLTGWTVQLWKKGEKWMSCATVGCKKELSINMTVTCAGCYSDLKDNAILREYVSHFPACPFFYLCAF